MCFSIYLRTLWLVDGTEQLAQISNEKSDIIFRFVLKKSTYTSVDSVFHADSECGIVVHFFDRASVEIWFYVKLTFSIFRRKICEFKKNVKAFDI
jgi:hypothetical protein